MNDVHSYMQGQSGLMDASSTHDLDFLNFDDRGPFLSKYEANDSHGLFSNSMNGFNVSQSNGTMHETTSPFVVNAKARFGADNLDPLLQNQGQLYCTMGNGGNKIVEDSANIGLYSGDNIQLATSELLNESGTHQHEYNNSSEINSNDNSPANLPDLALYNHNNQKMTINPKIAHSDLQPFMAEDHSVGIGMNNFQTIFDEASAKDAESNFGNLEMQKDSRSFRSNYSQYSDAEVDDEKTDDESEDEALAHNRYKRGKKDIAWRWTWLNLQISELHKQIQMCDSLLHNIQVEKEIVPADLGQECARTAGLRINKRVKIVKLAPPVQSMSRQFHPLFVPSLANVPSLTAPAPARPRGKQSYPMSPPRPVPRRKDLTMSTPNGARTNNKNMKNSSESTPRRKLSKSGNNLRRSTPSRPRDRDYDVDNIILPGRVSTLRRSVDRTPKEIFTPTFRVLPELSPEEEWQQWEQDHRAKKLRKQRRDEAQQTRDELKLEQPLEPTDKRATVAAVHSPMVMTDFVDSTSVEDDDDILLIKTSLESSPDKSRGHTADTSLDADLLRIESMASIDRAEALKSFQATLEQQSAKWKHESADADSQSVHSHSPVLISAPVPQLPVSCEDSSQCNRQSTAALDDDSESSSSYSSVEEDITDLSYALRHFKSELKERIRWEKPDPTSVHYNTHMQEREFLNSRLFLSYTPHHEEARLLPPELWQDNMPQEEEESYSYLHDRSDEESSHGVPDGQRQRRKRPASPSSESSHPPKRARIERRDDDFIRDFTAIDAAASLNV